MRLDEWLKSKDAKVEITDDYDGGCDISIRGSGSFGRHLASCTVSEFPGCCGIAVADHANADRSEYMAAVLELAKLWAKDVDYGLLLYATVTKQEMLIKTLPKVGFKVDHNNFINPKHNSKLKLWSFMLSQVKETDLNILKKLDVDREEDDWGI